MRVMRNLKYDYYEFYRMQATGKDNLQALDQVT